MELYVCMGYANKLFDVINPFQVKVKWKENKEIENR